MSGSHKILLTGRTGSFMSDLVCIGEEVLVVVYC